MVIKMNINQKIKHIINDKGLTISDMAKFINTSQANLSKILNGDNLKTEYFIKISEFLEMNMYEILNYGAIQTSEINDRNTNYEKLYKKDEKSMFLDIELYFLNLQLTINTLQSDVNEIKKQIGLQ